MATLSTGDNPSGDVMSRGGAANAPAPPAPLADAQEEAKAIVQAAAGRGVTLRITGGIAVRLACENSSRPNVHKDIDLVGYSSERRAVEQILSGRGYEGDQRFNALRGQSRLRFVDHRHGRDVDVFFDTLEMCHALPIRDRLRLDATTLSPTDLLLTKLQIVRTSERDVRDAVELLRDCPIDTAYIVDMLARDWGWWRTVTESLRGVQAFATAEYSAGDAARVANAVRELDEQIQRAPKSRRWNVRNKIGERATWYRLPEELEEDTWGSGG
jgi:hypothetical protein